MKFFARLLSVVSLLLLFAAPSFAADSTGAALLEVLHNKGIVDDASYSEIKKAGSEGGEQSMNKKLLDVLHQKGVLDDATYAKLSGQADAETKAAAVAAPVTTTPEGSPATAARRPLDKTLSSVEEGIARLSGDTVKLKIGTFIQAGWLNDDAGFSVAAPPTVGRSTTAGNQFFVRRARLFFDGMVMDKVGFKVSVEAADTTGKVLRDAFIFTDYIPYTRVTIGQFKIPFGLEGVQALGSLPVINRSFATNFIPYSTLRDLGGMVSGHYKTSVGSLPLGAGYAVGVFNGTGMNSTDDNDNKNVSGRVWVNPLVAGLTIGGSLYHGKTNTSSTSDRIKKDWDRWGADVEYMPAFAKGLRLQGEYLWARKYFGTYASQNVTSTSTPLPTFGRQAHSSGWYALASYRVDGLKGYWRYLNGFEPVVRYDTLDEDTSTQTAQSRDDSRYRTTIGLNYYINKYARLMADYEIIHADGALRTKSLETIDTIGHHLFTGVFQIKF